MGNLGIFGLEHNWGVGRSAPVEDIVVNGGGTMRRRRDLIPTEAIGLVVFMLFHRREKLTTAQVASLAQCSRQGAEAMMGKLSRKLPIVYDEHARVWYGLLGTNSQN